MSDRAGLIERAAALLRSGEAQVQPQPAARPAPPATPVAAPVAAPVLRREPAPPPPLNRTAVLDRGRLARSGITLPDIASTRAVEEFRIIKRNVMVGWNAPEASREGRNSPRILMVTSARPREGKTFTSVNLALAFASELDLTVVLVDADTIHRGVSRTLGIPPELGLIEVLTGKSALADTLVQTDLTNLIVLPPGANTPQTPEILAGAATRALFGQIAERYPNHVILLDSPPCLASSDPASLAPLVGQIIFVVEAGQTQQEEVEASLSLISTCPRISLLLNKSEARTSEHFGAYSYYYQADDKKADGRGEE